VAVSEYQYVIVDTAPSLDERSISVMEASDLVFIITTLDIPALKNVKIALETFKLFNFPVERLRLVMNRSDSQVGLDPREVEKSLGLPITGSIPSSRAVPAATNRGVAIIADQPHAPVSIAISRLVSQEIVKEAFTPDKRGFRVLRRKS
jgi:pilus assembly protein CpaE